MFKPTQTIELIPNDRTYSQQNTATLQAQLRRIMRAGGTIQFPSNQKFWINAVTASPAQDSSKAMTCVLEGNGSTLLCNTDNVERYFEIRTDGFLWNEHGRLIINNLSLESNTFVRQPAENFSGEIFAAGNGFAFENLRNIDLEVNRCTVSGFRSNIVINRCWPVTMNNCISRNGKYQLDVLFATKSVFNHCQFIEGRYGIILASSNYSVFNQHFVGCRFEYLRCLGLLTPPRDESVHETRFLQCYVENYGRPLILGLKLREASQRIDPMQEERDFLDVQNGQYTHFEISGGGVNNTWFVGNYWTQGGRYQADLGTNWNLKWFPEHAFAPSQDRPVEMPESQFETPQVRP